MCLSFFFLLPLGWALYYGEGDAPALIYTIIACAASGFFAWNYTRDKSEIHLRDGFAIVSLGWLTAAFWGALPAYISGDIPSFTDAYFESISGFTTTGASILTDVESMPHGILFLRSLTHWLGGMGIIVLSLAILPMMGIGGMQLFRAEVPGPVADKLTPRITQTAKILWEVYLLLTVCETALLMLGGMNLFEALCHTFGTMATGGFSTRNSSIAAYSGYIQWVIAVFMALAGCNFALHYHALKGKVNSYFKDTEFRFYIGVLAVSSILLIAANPSDLFEGGENKIRHTVFQVVSIMTTTGYGTHDYEMWAPSGHLLLLILMFVGGMAGSTGGGIKTMRVLILIKQARLELRQIIHPRGVFPVRLRSRVIGNDIIFNVFGFFLLYTLLFVAGALFLAFLNIDIVTAIGAAAACLNNIGPGLGLVGPTDNYHHLPQIGKWALAALMLLGRLEVYTVMVIFSRSYWKK